MKTAFEACRAYLDKLPAAVSGNGGHAATFKAAAWCCRFGLGDCEAMALLRDYSRRCSPPWTEKELAHKLADARRVVVRGRSPSPKPPPPIRTTWRVAPRSHPVVVEVARTACPVPRGQLDSVPPKSEPTPSSLPMPEQELQAQPLQPDELPWLHVAKQVLAGEFEGADRSARESLRIGMRSIKHPLVNRAMSLLNEP